MSSSAPLTTLSLPSLERIASGKNGIPNKGAVLTLLSQFWFRLLAERVPGPAHALPVARRPGLAAADAGRARPDGPPRHARAPPQGVLPSRPSCAATSPGSGYAEYAKSSNRPRDFRCPPGWGQHDENIHPDAAAALVGAAYAPGIERLALALYTAAADSRFWPADRYEVGREQESFDKQFVRDWLVARGLKGVDGVAVPDDVAAQTAEKYREIFEKLTGEPFEAAVARVGAA
ncbi:phosphoribosylaminoimidazole-succinocarboxamide synthase [Verticillium alfalfae VaMs.102]|uniref:Phosphoribosylaminoimidazole-succinocarboxamide synthase n=1 Tax=Verticillium alfalfae (strain VaMs.102 / ATCC MYA-4576 / FGSC 10136) TaxID=526221 RepID=C9SBK2_VERA1|nr:phosphoribosylaminoimidazole-succinocarboxamide synthase [Verticillium alfalfae VaMs.102]EEY15736.1 phosphoribosylaminoimidazole-succinocarboxamide synthase [Verticillium alfalfae VaMs.102]